MEIGYYLRERKGGAVNPFCLDHLSHTLSLSVCPDPAELASPLFTLVLTNLILISPRPSLGLAGVAPYRGIDIAARTMTCV